jgi:hypothetical protein
MGRRTVSQKTELCNCEDERDRIKPEQEFEPSQPNINLATENVEDLREQEEVSLKRVAIFDKLASWRIYFIY